MDINELIRRFRLASRELFNHFFHLVDPWKNSVAAWELEERFSEVETVLFEKLVSKPALLPLVAYGNVQTSIRVELGGGIRAPIMISSGPGTWDYPINEFTNEAVLLFIEFFDWDQLSYRDNLYALVLIDSWPSHPDAVGKRALIETQYVRFTRMKTAADPQSEQ